MRSASLLPHKPSAGGSGSVLDSLSKLAPKRVSGGGGANDCGETESVASALSIRTSGAPAGSAASDYNLVMSPNPDSGTSNTSLLTKGGPGASKANADCSIVVAVRVRPFSVRELKLHRRRPPSVGESALVIPPLVDGTSAFAASLNLHADHENDTPMPIVEVDDDHRTIMLLPHAAPKVSRISFQFDYVFSALAPSFELIDDLGQELEAGRGRIGSSNNGNNTALALPCVGDTPPLVLPKRTTHERSSQDGAGGEVAQLRGEDSSTLGLVSESTMEAVVVSRDLKAESDQAEVFECLGEPLLNSAWEGYNACIFTYGQTSSGKTYTMMGDRGHLGLIPRVCQALFQRIRLEQTRTLERVPESSSARELSSPGSGTAMPQCDSRLKSPVGESDTAASLDDRLETLNPVPGARRGTMLPDTASTDDTAALPPPLVPSLAGGRGPGSGSSGVGMLRHTSSNPPRALSSIGAEHPSHVGVALSLLAPKVASPTAAGETLSPSGRAGFVSRGPKLIKVTVAFMEIYNEQVRDLLKVHPIHPPRSGKGRNTNASAAARHQANGGGRALHDDGSGGSSAYNYQNLKVRQHPLHGPFVDGLTTVTVTTWEECERIIKLANRARAQSSTEMNECSSRSHAIFQLILTQTEALGARVHGKDVLNNRVSKINLVDLAGSERNRVDTGGNDLDAAPPAIAARQHFSETNSINQSLLTLRRVIDALVKMKKNSGTLIPYRESMLTWILSDNFGGNSKTIMCATISPHESTYQETESTLRYATLARGIVNRVKINEDPSAKLIRALQQQLKQLQEELSGKTRSSAHFLELQASIEGNRAAIKELKQREMDMARAISESKVRETELIRKLRHRERAEEKWKREAEKLQRQKEKLKRSLAELASLNPEVTNGKKNEEWIRNILHEEGDETDAASGVCSSFSETFAPSSTGSAGTSVQLDQPAHGPITPRRGSGQSENRGSRPTSRAHTANGIGGGAEDVANGVSIAGQRGSASETPPWGMNGTDGEKASPSMGLKGHALVMGNRESEPSEKRLLSPSTLMAVADERNDPVPTHNGNGCEIVDIAVQTVGRRRSEKTVGPKPNGALKRTLLQLSGLSGGSSPPSTKKTARRTARPEELPGRSGPASPASASPDVPASDRQKQGEWADRALDMPKSTVTSSVLCGLRTGMGRASSPKNLKAARGPAVATRSQESASICPSPCADASSPRSPQSSDATHAPLSELSPLQNMIGEEADSCSTAPAGPVSPSYSGKAKAVLPLSLAGQYNAQAPNSAPPTFTGNKVGVGAHGDWPSNNSATAKGDRAVYPSSGGKAHSSGSVSLPHLGNRNPPPSRRDAAPAAARRRPSQSDMVIKAPLPELLTGEPLQQQLSPRNPKSTTSVRTRGYHA